MSLNVVIAPKNYFSDLNKKDAIESLKPFYEARGMTDESSSPTNLWYHSKSKTEVIKLIKRAAQRYLDEFEAWFDYSTTLQSLRGFETQLHSWDATDYTILHQQIDDQLEVLEKMKARMFELRDDPNKMHKISWGDYRCEHIRAADYQFETDNTE